ncbi:MAG: osmoprotectant transport system permease protein [Pseudonocardiales bacterium]|jgi:osmoprotectant transport system permease protein|nr:binding-protein-dependent transport system inner rane component [Jatrophihabitans sp.]MDT4903914.1 osmoprotectant transport system permease protein [Pseudonocardiales bacterium]MDT4948725.1 osmoprotectant transport system permease protein [Pseudonocardiales bacterium]
MSNDFVAGFHFVFDRWGDVLQQKTLEHLAISGEAVAISILIGVPLGCLLGHLHRFSFIAINTSNLARALPTLAVLSILLPYTGIGDTTAIIALVILAAPPILTNSYVAVDQVDADTIDAAKGIGLRAWQVLLRVELPLALPLIFAGIRTAAVFVVATATLKGFFGGGGLGDVISNPASFKISGIIGASYVLIVMSVLAQLLFLGIEYLVTPVGLRRRRLSSPLRRGGVRPATEVGDDALATSQLEQAQLKQAQLEQGSITR